MKRTTRVGLELGVGDDEWKGKVSEREWKTGVNKNNSVSGTL